MTRTAVTISLALALAACGGGGGHSGSTGPQGTPGKSAYEIWLEQGNVGTEQDFLDSLVSGGGGTGGNTGGNTTRPGEDDIFVPKNKGEEIEHYINKGLPYYDYNKTTMAMPNGQEYNQYKYSEDGEDSLTGAKYTSHYTYNEKELKLGNYIMYTIDREYEDGKVNKFLNFQIMNRAGNSENVVMPASGAIFKGNTWAQVSAPGGEQPEILAGDITFKYDYTNPELVVALDNYYQIEFAKTGGYNYNIKISGENSTGKTSFDLPVGEYKNKVPAFGPGGTDGFLKTTILGKDGVEEAFGEYNASFDHNDFNPNYDVQIRGVFGGTKQ